jgi:hypothetical protein
MSDHEHSEGCGCEHEAIVKLLFDDRMAGPHDQKLASLDRTIEQFGALRGLADRRLVARALFSKAELLSRLGRHGDAVGACADLERRAQDDEDVDVQVWLGSATGILASQ